MNCIIPSVEWNRGETSLYIKYIEAFYSEEGVTMGLIVDAGIVFCVVLSKI